MYTKDQINKIKEARIYIASICVQTEDIEAMDTAESMLEDAANTLKKDRGGQGVQRFALGTLSCLVDDEEVSPEFAGKVEYFIKHSK